MHDSRILVVDDHRDNVAIIRDFLEARGYDVAVAHSGEEALRQYEDTEPALVLLDVMMPDRNGYMKYPSQNLQQSPSISADGDSNPAE
jgi:CheY-like chemotaxis protein